MKRASLAVLFLVFITLCAMADNTPKAKVPSAEDILKYLSDKALSVNIKARLLDSDETVVWNAESTQVTLSGRAVRVRLKSENGDVLINANITPFGSADNSLLLVAYGEVWFSDASQEGIKYESFLKSLPVKGGEKVILFPLGVAVDSKTNVYTIELEIQVQPLTQESTKKK